MNKRNNVRIGSKRQERGKEILLLYRSSKKMILKKYHRRVLQKLLHPQSNEVLPFIVFEEEERAEERN